MDSTVPVGAEAGVLVGVAVVAVGSGVGAGLSLQALRTTAMARAVRATSQRIRAHALVRAAPRSRSTGCGIVGADRTLV